MGRSNSEYVALSPVHQTPNQRNGDVNIYMGPASPESPPSLPPEKWKTLVIFLFGQLAVFVASMGNALINELVPPRDTNQPLPDVFFKLKDRWNWAFRTSETIGIIMFFTWLIIGGFFHKHRFIILRRSWLLVGLLYMMRCVTMFVTVLPVPSNELKCSPKVDFNMVLIFRRAFQLLSGAGLSITGVHYLCGDYIFSGHTFMLTMTYLFIKEYTPKRFVILHWITWLMSVAGVFFVMCAHEHYTIDIIIAYWLATRMFWTYHTIANNKYLKKSEPSNYLTREFWFPLLLWCEKNVGGVVPNEYEWPLPWPQRLAGRTWIDS